MRKGTEGGGSGRAQVPLRSGATEMIQGDANIFTSNPRSVLVDEAKVEEQISAAQLHRAFQERLGAEYPSQRHP